MISRYLKQKDIGDSSSNMVEIYENIGNNSPYMSEIHENIGYYINYQQLHCRRMAVPEVSLRKDFRKVQNMLIINLVDQPKYTA